MGRYGAYGKMPGLGDFFRLGVAPGFVSVWDAWLQRTMHEARAALGERWDECYLSAPIWRFALAAGVAGAAPVFGVLMPSVDRVGRRFPLTLVARGACQDAEVFAALENVALDALEDGVSKADLATALDRVPEPEKAEAAQGGYWASQMGDALIEMRTPGLPQGKDATALFDVSPGVVGASA